MRHIQETEQRVAVLQEAQLTWAETSLKARRALAAARTRAVVAVATRYGASVTQLHSLRRGMYDGGWTVELERSGELVDKLFEWGHEYHGESDGNEEWEFEIIAELVCEMWAEVVLETEAWVRRTQPVLDSAGVAHLPTWPVGRDPRVPADWLDLDLGEGHFYVADAEKVVAGITCLNTDSAAAVANALELRGFALCIGPDGRLYATRNKPAE